MKAVPTLFHILAWFFCLSSMYVFDRYVNGLKKKTKDYWLHWNSLPCINLHVQFIFFTLSLISHMTCLSLRIRAALNRIKTTFLASVALPSCLSIMFHFYLLAELGLEVNSKASVKQSEYTPAEIWKNQELWYIFFPVAPFDLIVVHHSFPNHNFGSFLSMVGGVAYIIWLRMLHGFTGVWIYPVMGQLDIVGSFCFFMSELYLVSKFYTIGESLNSILGYFSRPQSGESFHPPAQ